MTPDRYPQPVSGTGGIASPTGVTPETPSLTAPGVINAWLLQCDDYSETWNHHSLEAVHLRHTPGTDQTSNPTGTHQIVLAALEATAVTPTVSSLAQWRRLPPFNLVERITVPSDAAACWVTQQLAHRVADGTLPTEHESLVDLWRPMINRYVTEAQTDPARR